HGGGRSGGGTPDRPKAGVATPGAESAAEVRQATPRGGPPETEAHAGRRARTHLKFAEGQDRGPRPCTKCGRMLEENTRVCPVCIEKSKTFLRLLLLARPYWRRLILLVLLMVAGTGISMVPPYLYKVLIDDVLLPRAHPDWLLLLVAGIYGMQVLGSGIGAIRECLNAELGARIASELRGRVYRHLQTLSLGYYDKQKIGNVMDRVGRDAGNLQHFLVHHVDYLVIQALQFAVVSVILLALNWRLALIVIVPMPFAVAAFRWVLRMLIRRWRRMWDVTTRLTSFLNDSISGVRVIKAFGSEPVELRKFERRNRDVYEYSSDLGQIEAVLWPMLMLLMEIVTVLIWFFGGRGILGGEMTLGTLTAYMFYVSRFVQSAQSFGFFGRMTTQSMTSAERVFEVLDEKPEIEDAEDAVPMPRIEGRIEFRDVVFGYDRFKPVIKKLSFTVEPGQMLGLVGPSGAGKSTTINILARLYDVQEGQILIDGVDIKKIRQADLRSQIGVVLQETFLFSGTIGENIAYGRSDASRTDILRAATAACAHDFIMRLPDGYDTDVGEKGGKLSGGEKQRIAIARAILHDPRILILDEATSSVDTETENQIQKGLKRLIQGRTTIAIAHRLSTLRHANMLLVLEKGEKVEMGTHDELMVKEKGAYRKLVEMQTEWSKIIAYR
ncbi:MAG: ABC transporter transmembrane domain-containing protein, partial [Planctomycetota bacterium]|nr:ABC transporter transmembrane domain-containing protein [Planctomycetota bacterium]